MPQPYKSFRKEPHSRGEKGFRDITTEQNRRVRHTSKALLATIHTSDSYPDTNFIIKSVDLL